MKTLWKKFRWNMYPHGPKNTRFFVCECYELLKRGNFKPSKDGPDKRFIEHPGMNEEWIRNDKFTKMSVDIYNSQDHPVLNALYKKFGGNYLFDYPVVWVHRDGPRIVVIMDINL